jgi:hypothetical protein
LLIRTYLRIIKECLKLDFIACETFLNLLKIMSKIRQNKLNLIKVQLNLVKLLKGDIPREELELKGRYLNKFLFLA